MSTTYCFDLPDIYCISCVRSIKTVLSSNDSIQVESCYIDMTTKRITLIANDSGQEPAVVRELIRSSIIDAGFSCEDIKLNKDTTKESEKEKNEKHSWFNTLKNFINSHWFLSTLGIGSGVILLILSLVFSGGFPLAVMVGLGVSSSILTLLLGAPFYYSAAKKLIKSRALTMDLLFSISTLIVIGVSLTAFAVPWLPMMFEAGLLIFGFRHLGVAVEDSLKLKVAGTSFQDRLPAKVAVLIDEEQMESRDLASIREHDLLLLHAGDLIPIDGICMDEESLVYDTIITGATVARRIKRGERLLSGMRLAEGATTIRLKATASAAESYLAKLDADIIEALSKQSPIEDISEKILQYFIPTVLILAIVAATLIALFFPPSIAIPLAIHSAVLILVSACPCILGTVPSLGMKIGINKAAEHNVLFKSAEALQAAADIDVVVIDLHGTLTTGIPEGYCHSNNQDIIAEERMLEYFAAIEQKYIDLLGEKNPHPIAKAICNYVNRKITSVSDLQVEELDHSNHSGLIAKINGQTYILGNQTMMQEYDIPISHLQDGLQLRGGDSVVYLASNKQVLGYTVLTDPLRADAKRTIDALSKMGKEVHICTGADETTAYRYAKQLNILQANVRAACVGISGEFSKVAYIEELKAKGFKVAMVGDGGNDTLAFVNSHFSIAMKSQAGDEMTQVQAGAVIQDQYLLPIANAFAIAKQTVANIKQNLIFSLSYNVAVELIIGISLVGLGFVINPAVGVILMIVQASLVMANAFRFKYQQLDHLQQPQLEEDYQLTQSYNGLHRRMNVNGLDLGVEPPLSPEKYSTEDLFRQLKSPQQISSPQDAEYALIASESL